MAAGFTQKEWKDRITEFPTRRQLAIVSESDSGMTVDVSRAEGLVSQEGDAYSAANMNGLEQRIKASFDNVDNDVNGVKSLVNAAGNNISGLTTRMGTAENNISGLTSRMGTAESNITKINGDLSKVKVYVGSDGKLHFVDRTGADTALPFNPGKLYTGNCSYEGTDAYTAAINLPNISKSNMVVLQSIGVSESSYRACIVYAPSIGMFGLLEGADSDGFIWASNIPYSFPSNDKMTVSGAIPGTGFVWRNPAGCQGIQYYAII